MKTLIASIVALVVLAFTGAAQAQSYSPQSVSGIPTALTAATNLATPVFLSAPLQRNLAIAVTLNSTSAGQTNTYTFCKTVDGSKYDTNTPFTFVAINAGGGERTTVTNFDTVGYQGWVLTRIAPTGTDSVTQAMKYFTTYTSK